MKQSDPIAFAAHVRLALESMTTIVVNRTMTDASWAGMLEGTWQQMVAEQMQHDFLPAEDQLNEAHVRLAMMRAICTLFLQDEN